MSNSSKGPLIGFAGATFADKPMLEPLTPMFAFNTNANDSNASRPLSRALGGMTRAIESLKKYYAQVDAAVESDAGNAILHQQVEYPYRNHYTTAGNKVEFQYDQRLDQGKLLFLCSRTTDETKVCVKFTQKYSTDAHKYCADKGVAPELYAVEKLPGGWLMVVMEYLDSYTALVDLSSKVTMSCETAATAAVGILHDGGFVHGDVRDANMMVENGTDENSQRSVKLVDFDWAGKDEETTYPPNVNYTQIRRPMEAKDGMPIKMSHDNEMLSYIFSPASTQSRDSSA
jgi:serine/threonine protein kinase